MSKAANVIEALIAEEVPGRTMQSTAAVYQPSPGGKRYRGNIVRTFTLRGTYGTHTAYEIVIQAADLPGSDKGRWTGIVDGSTVQIQGQQAQPQQQPGQPAAQPPAR